MIPLPHVIEKPTAPVNHDNILMTLGRAVNDSAGWHIIFRQPRPVSRQHISAFPPSAPEFSPSKFLLPVRVKNSFPIKIDTLINFVNNSLMSKIANDTDKMSCVFDKRTTHRSMSIERTILTSFSITNVEYDFDLKCFLGGE